MNDELTNIEQSEKLKGFLDYYKLLSSHIQLVDSRFNMYQQFLITICSSPDIVSQCYTFVQETNTIFLENIVLGLMRIYEQSNGRDKNDDGLSLFYLCKHLDEMVDYTSVTTVDLCIHRRQKGLLIQNNYDDSVIKYVKGRWKTSIISNDNVGIQICLNIKECSTFINELANMICRKYKNIFNLRNKFLAHNDFEFGKKLPKQYPISYELFDFCEACLDVCDYCIQIISKLFISDKTVLILKTQQDNIHDINLLFNMASAYLNTLPIISESNVECSNEECGRTYKQIIRQQKNNEFTYLNDDVCPYCRKINNSISHSSVSYINIPIETPIERIMKVNQTISK